MQMVETYMTNEHLTSKLRIQVECKISVYLLIANQLIFYVNARPHMTSLWSVLGEMKGSIVMKGM